MASITPRKNKAGEIISYTIRVYRGYDINNNRLKPYLMTWKPDSGMTDRQIQKELQRQALQFERQCKNGEAATSNIKLGDFCAQYLETAKTFLSPATYEFYDRNIEDYIKPALGHLKLKDIKPAHVQQYVQQLTQLPKRTRGKEAAKPDEKIAASTVRRYLTVLQSIFKQAVKLGVIADSPAKTERLTIPKAVQPKIPIFTKQETAEMLTCLEKEPLQFQVLIQLAIHTGARRGELVALKFSDVDFDGQKITIERAAVKLKGQKTQTKPPKDYEVRTVTVSPACIELIEQLKQEKQKEAAKLGTKWQEGDWIFTTWNGEPMNPQTPTHWFSKFLENNNLPHRKFHALRHTSATLLLYGGISIKQVQSRLGHGDPETTHKYLHVIEEADAEAAKVLENILDPTAPTAESQPPIHIRA